MILPNCSNGMGTTMSSSCWGVQFDLCGSEIKRSFRVQESENMLFIVIGRELWRSMSQLWRIVCLCLCLSFLYCHSSFIAISFFSACCVLVIHCHSMNHTYHTRIRIREYYSHPSSLFCVLVLEWTIRTIRTCACAFDSIKRAW